MGTEFKDILLIFVCSIISQICTILEKTTLKYLIIENLERQILQDILQKNLSLLKNQSSLQNVTVVGGVCPKRNNIGYSVQASIVMSCHNRQVCLHSMHKYQPVVHIKSTKSTCPKTKYHATFMFPQTVFTTVTAYQNQQVNCK